MMLRMAEAGYRTGILDLTAGEMGTRGTPEIRMSEAEDAARILRAEHRENMRFPDARLENTMAGRMTLAAKIRELRVARLLRLVILVFVVIVIVAVIGLHGSRIRR